MEHNLPYVLEVKPPISKLGIIIFASCMVIVDFFIFIYISLLAQSQPINPLFYSILLAPILLFFIGFFFAYASAYRISLEEDRLVYKSFLKNIAFPYSAITSISCLSITTTKGGFLLHAGDIEQIVINAESIGACILNPRDFSNEKIKTFLDIIISKNSTIEFDEGIASLRAENPDLVQKELKKNIMFDQLSS